MLFLVWVKGDVSGQEVHQVHGIVDVLHRKGHFTSVGTHVAQHAQCDLDDGLHQYFILLVACQRQFLLDQCNRAAQVGQYL